MAEPEVSKMIEILIVHIRYNHERAILEVKCCLYLSLDAWNSLIVLVMYKSLSSSTHKDTWMYIVGDN